jgi:hypothetical protein
MLGKGGNCLAKEVVLDFSGVRPFEPLDPSVIYLIRVDKLENRESKEGKPLSHCEISITAPEEVQVEEWIPDEEAPEGMRKVGMKTDDKGNPVMTKAKGRKLFREFSLQPQALPFLHEFIKAVDPSAKLDDKYRYNPDKFVGLEGACKINNEAFNEQIRARVARMYPASAYKE